MRTGNLNREHVEGRVYEHELLSIGRRRKMGNKG